jgi:hypothetical protein
MRIESSVTSVSWIPLGATEGFNRLTFGLLRVAHFDPPPPDVLGDLDELLATTSIRFANRLEAWIEVQHGRVVDAGQSGGGRSGAAPRRRSRRSGGSWPPAGSSPQPHKRPKSSSTRFAAEQPNERWQLDLTHWAWPTTRGGDPQPPG